VLADLYPLGHGALAELVCAPERAFAPMSPGMSFEDAAALPHAAILAPPGAAGKAGGTGPTRSLRLALESEPRVPCGARPRSGPDPGPAPQQTGRADPGASQGGRCSESTEPIRANASRRTSTPFSGAILPT